MFINLLVPVLIVLFGLVVPVSDVGIVWCSLSVTCFIVSSIISPWSVSTSELDWTRVGLLASGVLWDMGCWRLLTVGVKLLVILCTWLWPGEGCLMGDVLDSSLTLLPLISLMCSKEGSISFVSSCFNTLGNWFVFCHFCLLNIVRLHYDSTKD